MLPDLRPSDASIGWRQKMAKRSYPKPRTIYKEPRKNLKTSGMKPGVFAEPLSATRKVAQILGQRLSVLKNKETFLLLGAVYAVYANYFFIWLKSSSDFESDWLPFGIFGIIAALTIFVRFWASRFPAQSLSKAFLWIRTLAPFGLIPLIIYYAQHKPTILSYIILAVGVLVSGVIAYQSAPILFSPSDK